jgi:hypothetical protein
MAFTITDVFTDPLVKPYIKTRQKTLIAFSAFYYHLLLRIPEVNL